MKQAAVSIDLDPLAPLALRRGLQPPDPDVVYKQALPRFRALLDQAGVRATFFAVGADARRPIPRSALATLVDEGHEVANHSHDHPDDFAGLHPEALHQQVVRAEDAIASATGVRPVGFRAPAWAVSGALLEVLERRGYRYDSSVLPSPLTGALALVYRVREGGQGPRPFGDPRLGRAPVSPYHPDLDEPWRVGDTKLLELPVAAGMGRLPAWFTPALALGPRAVPLLHAVLAASPAPQWLLHGADLLDASEAPIVATRPGMHRSLETRQAMVRDLLGRLASRCQVAPLRDLAASWSEPADAWNPGPEVYRDALLSVAPRLVSLLDRDPISPTRGSFDRTWWGWKFIDFPTPRMQEGVYPLAVLWRLDHADNPLLDRPVVLDWIAAALRHWCGMQHNDGSFDEAWPNERSLAATAFGSFWVCEALDIVGEFMPDDLNQRLDGTLARAGDWLAEQDEPHAFISNHLAAAAAALQAISRRAAHPRATAASERLLARILDAASPEGWLPEYGGADPGYQTHTLLYLACMARHRDDPRLDAVLASAADFLGWFVHPDGAMGGEYGSRNTRHVSPGGFELLGQRLPAAAALARATRLALLEGHTVALATMDQQNLVPLACSTALAWSCACDVADAPPLPRDRPGERHFPQAGLYVRVTDAFHAVVSQRKGVVAVFGRPRDGAPVRDLWACGWVGRLDKRVISSQPPALAQQDPLPSPEHGADGQRILRLTLPMYGVNHDVFRPARFVAFRLATLTATRPRAAGRLLKRAVVRRLVTGARPTRFVLQREITLGDSDITVHDRVTGPAPLPTELRPEARFTAIHMGSSRYFVAGDTNPEPELEVDSTSAGEVTLRARWS